MPTTPATPRSAARRPSAPATPRSAARRLSKVESNPPTPPTARRRSSGSSAAGALSTKAAGAGGIGSSSPAHGSSVARCAKISGLETCAPDEAGLDARSLEDHRLRNRWQSSLGILPGLAECVIAGNRVAFLDLMGSADVERGIPVSPSTLFRCFSMTKPITAVAVMRLVQEKKIALDDPVSKYIPSFQAMQVVKPQYAEEWGVTAESYDHLEPAHQQITLRHLLTHTSGLAYGPDRVSPTEPLKAQDAAEGSYLTLVEAVDSGTIQSLCEFCDALAKLPLRFQPGTQWMYSHGVDVAGRVIEVASGRPLDAFLREEVFQPLGMTRTTFFVGRDKAQDLAAMYLAEKENIVDEENLGAMCKLKRCDGAQPEESRWFRGSKRVLAGGGIMGSCQGGLVSCLRDMARFVSMLANGGVAPCGRRLLSPSTIRALWRDWLTLSSVVGPGHSGRRRPLPGWEQGTSIGWTPLGHVRKRDKCLYMGGWSTSWAIYPQTRLATISMSQSLVYFDIPGWVARRDELDSAVEFGVAQHRRRLAALVRHRREARLPKSGRRLATDRRSRLAVPRSLLKQARPSSAAKARGNHKRSLGRRSSSDSTTEPKVAAKRRRSSAAAKPPAGAAQRRTSECGRKK
mmetsp:Transcript_77173/g.224033  ORF Transcript_77173/g.224033 Transcript_77173/m.224033 type:complete len:629 (-) Transcript_77173:105-1991(-)